MVDKKVPRKEVGVFVKNLVAELEQSLDTLGAAQLGEKQWPCRWIHMAGLNYKALDQLQQLLQLSDDVVDAAKKVAGRPDVSWCPAPRISDEEPDSPFDHLFVVSQYIQVRAPCPPRPPASAADPGGAGRSKRAKAIKPARRRTLGRCSCARSSRGSRRKRCAKGRSTAASRRRPCRRRSGAATRRPR